jgi:CBS-domain-containing membrane protein
MKVSSAAKIMKEANLGALPVLDKDQKVIGMITDRDICLSMVAKSGKLNQELNVQETIGKNGVRTIKIDDTVADALKEMRKSRIGRLPVTDKEGKLKGMLSVNNLLSRAISRNEAFGLLTSKDENLAKTVKAIVDRNNSKAVKERKEALGLELVD